MLADLFFPLLLVGMGLGVAFRGWWLYEQLLLFVGFLVGLFLGSMVASAAGLDGVVGFLVVVGGGVLGAYGYYYLHVLGVLLFGFVVGVLFGSVLFGVNSGDWTSPLVLLTGLGGALLAWEVHKAIVVVGTAVLGATLVGKVVATWPMDTYRDVLALEVHSGAFFLVFLAGIAVQYGFLQLEADEGEPVAPVETTLERLGAVDEPVGDLLRGRVAFDELVGTPPRHRLGDAYRRCERCRRYGRGRWRHCHYCGAVTDAGPTTASSEVPGTEAGEPR